MTNNIKKAFCLVLALQCASAQAFEVKFSVNGEDIVEGAKEAGKVLINGVADALKRASMHPLHTAVTVSVAGLSLISLKAAYEKLQESKKRYRAEEEGVILAIFGTLLAGVTGELLLIHTKSIL